MTPWIVWVIVVLWPTGPPVIRLERDLGRCLDAVVSLEVNLTGAWSMPIMCEPAVLL